MPTRVFATDEDRATHRGWVQTSVSAPMHRWVIGLSRNPYLPYGTALAMYTSVFTEFIERRPWDHGLEWREARSKTMGDAVQVNVELADTTVNGQAYTGSEFADLVRRTSAECGVSVRTFAATVLFYLAAYKHPPAQRKP